MTTENTAGHDIVTLDARVVRATDYLVHGWDVARSLGLDPADYELEPDLLAAALPVAKAVPDGAPRTLGLVPFAPGISVTRELSVLDQIVAMLGRNPSWPQ
jgi:hypothetical protein